MRAFMLFAAVCAAVFAVHTTEAQQVDPHYVVYLTWKQASDELSDEEQQILGAELDRRMLEDTWYKIEQVKNVQNTVMLFAEDAQHGIPLMGYWTNSENYRFWFYGETFIAEKLVQVSPRAGLRHPNFLPMVLDAGFYVYDGSTLTFNPGGENEKQIDVQLTRRDDGRRVLEISEVRGERIELESTSRPEFSAIPQTNLQYMRAPVVRIAAGVDQG